MAKFLRFQKKSLEGTVTSRRKKFGLSLSKGRSHSLALDADRHSRRAVRVETGRPRVAVTGEAVAVMGFHKGLCMSSNLIDLDWSIRWEAQG